MVAFGACMVSLLRRIPFCRAGPAIVAAANLVACGGRHVQPVDTTAVKSCSDELKSKGQTSDLYLATGSPTGTYVRLGAAIARYAQAIAGLGIRPCTTDGSTENLNLLRRSGSTAFALVQLDVLHEAAIEGALGPADHDVRVVAYLYSEKLHVFVRPHRYLSSPADLGAIADKTDENGISNQERIWLGPARSGGYRTAEKVLEAAGIPDEDIHRLGKTRADLDWSRAANALLRKKGDDNQLPPDALIAYFRTMAVPRPFTNGPARMR
jgi:TRAP-type uncharacterized transport system substrate-binding protein